MGESVACALMSSSATRFQTGYDVLNMSLDSTVAAPDVFRRKIPAYRRCHARQTGSETLAREEALLKHIFLKSALQLQNADKNSEAEQGRRDQAHEKSGGG